MAQLPPGTAVGLGMTTKTNLKANHTTVAEAGTGPQRHPAAGRHARSAHLPGESTTRQRETTCFSV